MQGLQKQKCVACGVMFMAEDGAQRCPSCSSSHGHGEMSGGCGCGHHH
ncbi:MAG TPA: hypothetical protein VJL54_03405 [Nitrososphaera sp.]|nr:hypothetical protein [Nitrososphaera sp.]